MLKRLLIALSLVSLFCSPSFAQSYRLADAIVEQGGTASVSATITGTRTAKSYVLLYTGIPTDVAKPGVDYAPISKIFEVQPTDTRISLDVSTLINDVVPGPAKDLTTKLVIISGGTLLDGTGRLRILDSDVQMQTCWDGSVIPATQPCPIKPPPMVTCPDGSQVPEGTPCPEPPPVQCPDGSTVPAGQQCPVVPPPVGTSLVIESDSTGVDYVAYWSGMIKKAHAAEWPTCITARSGSVIGNPTDGIGALRSPERIAAVKACNPKAIIVNIGTNDLARNATVTAKLWTDRYRALIADYRAAMPGVKIAIATPFANANPNQWAGFQALYAKNRAEVSPILRDWKATGIVDDLIDIVADPVLGPDSSALDLTLYNTDAMHPRECYADKRQGHCFMFNLADPVAKRLMGTAPTEPPPDGGGGTEPPPVVIEGVGLPPIPSNFDVNETVRGGLGVPPAQDPAHEVQGAMRFICGPSWIGWVDPIVNPGGVSSHLHQGYGNTYITPTASYAESRATGDSTCNATGKGISANRSQYWLPAMLDGKGNIIQPFDIKVYYKREPASSATCQRNKCVGIPNGLQFVFGFDVKKGVPNAYPAEYLCTSPADSPISAVFKTLPELVGKCPPGNYVTSRLATPKCWNGKDVDSLDDRSHLAEKMVYNPTYGTNTCPADHPYLIPQFTQGARYKVIEGDDLALWHYSSDEMFPNLPHGSTLHADYKEAWDSGIKSEWLAYCIDKFLNCSAGELGSGRQLLKAASGNVARVYPQDRLPLSQFPKPAM